MTRKEEIISLHSEINSLKAQISAGGTERATVITLLKNEISRLAEMNKRADLPTIRMNDELIAQLSVALAELISSLNRPGQ